MNPLIAEMIGSFIRQGLAVGAGYMASTGLWNANEAAQFTSAVAMALTSLIWSLYRKYENRLTLVTALASNEALSEAEAKDRSVRASAPSVTTSSDDVPVAR